MRHDRDQRPFNAKYYALNRQREIDRVRRRQDATVAFLRELRRVPCVDCAGRFDPVQMDFDHRDSAEKSFEICSGRASLKSREALLAEIAKCDVVCANCHRLRTRRQHRARLATKVLSDRPRTREKRAAWRYKSDLLDQIRSVPCADCGKRYAQCCMDFDHRDSATKIRNVPAMIASYGFARILEEIAKCDIVCANCHRLRTSRRRSSRAA